MGSTTFNFEVSRNLLSRAILEAVNSWPELDRRIFIQAHYSGKSIAEIANAFAMSPQDVSQALQRSEHLLHDALKTFRDGDAPEASCKPYQEFNHSSACCFL